ncbi:MAG: hypothetical protein NVS9B10_13340 [Nevskia sp.]
MAATIHSLFPSGTEARTPAHPLLTELQDSSLGMLDETLRRMFDNADDSLFEMGEKAPSDAERRSYFDTMRVLRIDRNRITREFSQQLARGFTATVARLHAVSGFDIDSLAIQPTEELEERIALNNLAAKVEGLHKSLIWDLERRLEIAQARGIPISPQALSPSRICEAFGNATSVLETQFQVKLVIFKLFDRVLSHDLDGIYRAALELLDREGLDTRRPPAPTGASAAVAGGPAVQTFLELLRRYGVEPGSVGISNDAAGGAALQELLQNLMARGGQDGFEASAQRLSMASQMFNELLSEPLLSDTLRSAFEPLRYPLYRTALTDPAFFTSVAHPTRKMLGQLVELAGATQTGEVSTARFRTLLQSMIAQADNAAAAGSGAGGGVLSGLELDGFLTELREQARARRGALLVHVRRLIAQELELRTVGREVPKPVLTLLRSGIGPLMAVRLLKNGRGSAPFRDAEGLLEQVLATLDAVPVAAAEFEQRQTLMANISAAFGEIGMAEDRSLSLLNGLRQIYAAQEPPPAVGLGKMGPLTDLEKAQLLADYAQEVLAQQVEVVEAKAAAAAHLDSGLPKITALELLSRVLTPESWFRVFDASQNQTRWLKLDSFYASRDSVTFTGFDESTRLSLRASRLAEDLIQGHSEPINPTSSAREALEQLREAKARGLI